LHIVSERTKDKAVQQE